MTKVKITIKGALDFRAANIDNKPENELKFVDDVAEADVPDGKHKLFWRVRGWPGTSFTVGVKPGLKEEPEKATIPEGDADEGEEVGRTLFEVPEPTKKDDGKKDDGKKDDAT